MNLQHHENNDREFHRNSEMEAHSIVTSKKVRIEALNKSGIEHGSSLRKLEQSLRLSGKAMSHTSSNLATLFLWAFLTPVAYTALRVD
jgi:hypothetical protein